MAYLYNMDSLHSTCVPLYCNMYSVHCTVQYCLQIIVCLFVWDPGRLDINQHLKYFLFKHTLPEHYKIIIFKNREGLNREILPGIFNQEH